MDQVATLLPLLRALRHEWTHALVVLVSTSGREGFQLGSLCALARASVAISACENANVWTHALVSWLCLQPA